ncbi:MAG TPA: hypothetical protein VF676_02060 [Flavobacterium sp.]|jgi:hypothetical protein
MNTPISIFIIGDDATANLFSGYALQTIFAEPDLRFFNHANTALDAVERGDIAGTRTLIFLDSHIKGMRWQMFLKSFNTLPRHLKCGSTIFISDSANGSIPVTDVPLYSVPYPLRVSDLKKLARSGAFKYPQEQKCGLPQFSEHAPDFI